MTGKIRPTRKSKDKEKGFYKLETGCGKLAITIRDGEDDYPIRLIVEPIGGGCSGGIELLRRGITYNLECNMDIEAFIDDVLEKIICPSAKTKKQKNPDKEIYLSCAKAVAFALRDHLRGGEKLKEVK